MFVYLSIGLLDLIESTSEGSQSRRLYFTLGIGFGVGLIFVMYKLERSGFSNLAIVCVAVGAYLCLATLFVDFLADLCTLQVIDTWSS